MKAKKKLALTDSFFSEAKSLFHDHLIVEFLVTNGQRV